MNGLVLIDKPGGCTSHDVVNRWRRLAGTKRVGHLGTLDPMATGLLSILTGPATRLAQFYGKEDKTYLAEITFGVVSDTYDAEGVVTVSGVPIPAAVEIEAALDHFRGTFYQTPPLVSAKKIGGVAAYKLARKKIEVVLQPVEITVRELRVEQMAGNCLCISVTCSAGTYIRSIAHDLGERLGCGALLSRLRRTRSGSLSVEQARTIVELTALQAAGRLAECVVPAGELLPHLPAAHVDLQVEGRIRQGREFRTSPFVVPPGAPLVRALSRAGELIAIGELVMPNIYHPMTVL